MATGSGGGAGYQVRTARQAWNVLGPGQTVYTGDVPNLWTVTPAPVMR